MTSMKSTLIVGLSIGFFLALIVTLHALTSRMRISKKDAFDAVFVGMPKEDAVRELRARAVECGLTEPTENGNICQFSDPWRLYVVAVDAKTGLVRTTVRMALNPFTLRDSTRPNHTR